MLRILGHVIDEDWQTTDYAGGWSVREDFVDENGRLVVKKLTIYPTAALPIGGLNSRVLRQIHVGQVAELMRQAITKYPNDLRALQALFPAPKRRRRKWARNSDRFYAELAAAYVAVLKTPEGRDRPVAVLATLRKVQVKRLRAQLHLARRNGFLSQEKQGKAGGTLTALAQLVLSQKEEA